MFLPTIKKKSCSHFLLHLLFFCHFVAISYFKEEYE